MRSVPEHRLVWAIASLLCLAAGCQDGRAGSPDAMTDTNVGDTDIGDTDIGDTDIGDTDVGDTEAGTGTDAMIDEGPWDSLDERPCPDDSFLTYDNFGGPFMFTYCTGCHGSGVPADQRQDAPTTINFDDVEGIRAHAHRVWARAADQNATMPPAGAPGEEERALLGEWLACGAP